MMDRNRRHEVSEDQVGPVILAFVSFSSHAKDYQT
jgi:hypothetical protein